MAEISWGKTTQPQAAAQPKIASQVKMMVGIGLLIAAVAYLIISGTSSGARYFITVDEIVRDSQYVGQTVRISGAVIGDTIVYDSQNLIIDFTIANIPEETSDLAATLHNVVNDPSSSRLRIHIENQVMPDLLQHEAQAILTGTLGADGVFYATELLLKCPSRYEEAVPGQINGSA
ncbi:MAG: cytochrome c maturation protein CcmE [Chloroflexi bacterium]|nr:cytochrome c maturation protein CcmE [Chloroflexota bacterium]